MLLISFLFREDDRVVDTRSQPISRGFNSREFRIQESPVEIPFRTGNHSTIKLKETRESSKLNLKPIDEDISSSSDNSLNPTHSTHSNIEGKIHCICGIQSYEIGMIQCIICRTFSHAECYKVDDLSNKHTCGVCAIKSSSRCSNVDIQSFLEK